MENGLKGQQRVEMLTQSRFNELPLLIWPCAALESWEAAFHVSWNGKITALSMKFIREFFSAA